MVPAAAVEGEDQHRGLSGVCRGMSANSGRTDDPSDGVHRVADSHLQVICKTPPAQLSQQPTGAVDDRTGREEGSTVSGVNQDVLRAIEIERLRIAKQARRARGLGR